MRYRRRRGYIFVFSVIVLAVLLLLGVMSVTIGVNNVKLSHRKEIYAQSLAAAEAGAWTAKSSLENMSTPPTTTQSGSGSLSTGDSFVTYSYTTTPLTPPTGYPNLLLFRIVSTGTTAEGGSVKAVMQVSPTNFAKFAYAERVALPGGWMTTGMRYNGPVHSNDTLSIYWDKSTGHPIFGDVVTSAQSSVNWWDAAHTPQTTTDWQNIFDAGQPALELGVKPLTFPSTSRLQQNRAWVGGLNIASSDTTTNPSPACPTTTGVYVNQLNNNTVPAGIYIVGQCSINFVNNTSGTVSSDGSGNQEIDITQGTTITKVIVNRATNTTTIQKTGDANPTSLTGVPNGMIYCTDNITGIQGDVVDNRVSVNGSGTATGIVATNSWTVATNIASNKTITVSGDLYYHAYHALANNPNDLPPASSTDPSTLCAGMLGLYGYDVQIAGTQPTYNIDAVVMAANGSNGTWQNANPTYTTSGGAVGNMYLTGGVINDESGLFGYFNSSTGAIVEGHTEHYTYDPRVVYMPPPFFPTTGGYNVVAWQII